MSARPTEIIIDFVPPTHFVPAYWLLRVDAHTRAYVELEDVAHEVNQLVDPRIDSPVGHC